MSEKNDLEIRIKALEEKLTPSPEKMSTMKATNRLKQTLDKMKGEKETQEDVVWKLIEQAQKVPELENENKELKKKIEELEKKQLTKEENDCVQDTLRAIDLGITEDEEYVNTAKAALRKLRM